MGRALAVLALLPALAILALGSSLVAGAQSDAAWTQWGGPNRDFIIEGPPLADSWPEGGPPVLWSRPLGVGHSTVLADDGMLFTMYRIGAASRRGPWSEEETVVALDATTGETIWEHTYPSRNENFQYGAGPHSTPLIVGDRLFTIGTNKQFYAFDKQSGEILWYHDLIADFGAPPLQLRPIVLAGYGCSPIAHKETIICTVGGPGQSVMAFNQSDGSVVWRGGDFLFGQAPPVLIDVDGQQQLVVVGGASINGMDPDTGEVLWAVGHDPGNDLNMTAGLWGDNNILFVSSAYRAGTHALQLSLDGDITDVDEVYYNKRLQLMFLNSVRIGDWVYGTVGTFGPKFMSAINVVTGEPAWRERGFGHASMVRADGKFIIMDEDGDLVLATMAPEGIAELARASIFETTSWTVPTLVGTTLYARDRAKIVALDLGPSGLR